MEQIAAALDDYLPGLAAALASGANPEDSAPVALRVIEAAIANDANAWRDVVSRQPEKLTRILSTICASAPFLARFLAGHPAVFSRLAIDEFSAERSADDYHSRLDVFSRDALDETAALRLFKYGELARITVRELSVDLVPPERSGETLAELSHLADAVLSRALDAARRRIAATLGPPHWKTADGAVFESRFCALGLGKLGGEELNYSSDVDLIYVYELPPATSRLTVEPERASPPEYFTRVAQEFGRIVGETTADGFLYRIDLDLRPEGGAGALVISARELESYYDLWAAAWEKAAFAKARPVAGDVDFGWTTIRAIDPMIYRSSMDFAAVAAIREMKSKIEEARERSGAGFDVKIGSGGIRDVEFVAQALQLLYGGRMAQVRHRSTQAALVRLAQVGILASRDEQDLLIAYRFLRRVENRLQMVDERQTHRVPQERAAEARLARSLGFVTGDPVALFEKELLAHRRRVQEVFGAVFPATAGSRVLALFQRNAPQLFANPIMRRRIEDLAEQFAHSIENGPSPERAMNNLDHFIQGVGARRFYYGLLLDRPELVPRLAALFAASEYLSGYFARHPRLIEPIFSDPNTLLRSRAEMEAELSTIRNQLEHAGESESIEVELDAMRLFHNLELVNIGLLDLAARVEVSQVDASLTDLAEVCIACALELARGELHRQRLVRDAATKLAEERGRFLVVGMGKLASRELTYGSDLDVIFVYDLPGAGEDDYIVAQEYFVRLAQKLIWALQTRTVEGLCYQVDSRLRPSGNQGTLVTSLPSLRRYHEQSAAVWERQALLRARAVAGAEDLAHQFGQLRLEILRRPLAIDAAAEIRRIRRRVENELARETSLHHDFKTGRGGLMDIECVVQYLQLLHGAEHEDLFEVDSIAMQIDRLERLRHLSAEDAATLRSGWSFLQRLSSRLRIVENRSISDLDEERGDLQDLALQLGYAAGQRSAARRALLDDYRRNTAAVRDVYERVLGESPVA